MSSCNHGTKYLCVIDIFTKYAWVNTLKNKKAETVLRGFIEILNKSICNPYKIWIDQGREFCNKLMQKWLYNNGIFMYSAHNTGKLVVVERFIRTLKVKIYKKGQVIIVNLILVFE